MALHHWRLGVGRTACAVAAGLGFSLLSALSSSPLHTSAAQENPSEEKKEGDTEAEKAEREFAQKYVLFVEALIQQARYDIASARLEELMAAPVTDEVFVRIFERNRLALRQLTEIAVVVPRLQAELEGRGEKALTAQDKQLLELCNKYPQFYETYKQKRAKVAADSARLEKLIPMLGKAEPTFRDAADQIKIAGSYAVPELLRAVSETEDDALLRGIERCFREYLEWRAVDPLTVTVRGSSKPKVRTFAIRMLGQIRTKAGMPVLAEIVGDPAADAADKELARKAIDALGETGRLSTPVHQLYYKLAEAYFDDAVTPKVPEGAEADVWVLIEDRPTPQKVAYPAYLDAMARRYAFDAIRTAPNNDYPDAWGLFLCATHRFEAKQKAAGAMELDPLKTSEKWLNSDYVTALAGPERIAAGLKKGMDPTATQTPAGTEMNIRLLEGLSLTGGQAVLLKSKEALQVLSLGLTHPNQVIRMETAIAAVRMRPSAPSPLWTRVVPALGEAVGLKGKESLLLVSGDPKIRDGLGNALEADYLVVRAETASAAVEVTNRQAGFSAVVITAPATDATGGLGMLKMLSENPALVHTPKLVLAGADKVNGLQNAVKAFGPAFAADVALEPEKVVELIKTRIKGPGLTDEKSLSYSMRAIDLLTRMAEGGDTRVFNYLLAEGALISCMDTDPRDEVAAAAAKALGLYPTPTAQRALAAAGVKGDGNEPVRLAALSGLAESARKNGNTLRDREDATLLEKLGALGQDASASQPLRTGATAAVGALAIPGPKLFELYKSAPREGAMAP